MKMKTATTVKLRYAKKFLKSAHNAMAEAIVADRELADFAMKNPNDNNVTMLITALVEINAAGKKLEELLEQYD